jgi:hypothetical protein
VREIAGFPAPAYSHMLAKYQWHKVGDLIRTPGEFWTTKAAVDEGHLPPAETDILEKFIRSLPKQWCKLLRERVPKSQPVYETWIAKISQEDGGDITNVGYPTWRNIKNIGVEEVSVSIDTEGQAMTFPNHGSNTTWNVEGTRILELQAILIHQTSGTQREWWSPGLAMDHAFNPWEWRLQAKHWQTPVEIPKINVKRLYDMLAAEADPNIWDWWRTHTKPAIPSRPLSLQGWQRAVIGATDPRPLNMRETSLRYFWMANRPQFMVSPAPCPTCSRDGRSAKHGIWDCPIAQAVWKGATDVMSAIMDDTVPVPKSWAAAVLGQTEISEVKEVPRWAPLWLAIHGSTILALHRTWVEWRHQGAPPTKSAAWNRFRLNLVQIVHRAFRAAQPDDLGQFWSTWGTRHILAAPSLPHPRNPHRATLALLPGVPTEIT